METLSTVTLSSNGKYWQAFYYDDTGKRRAKSLGPKSKISKRKARVLCDRFAAAIQLNPAHIGSTRTLRLDEYIDRYLASRLDLKPGSLDLHRHTCKFLLAYFGPDTRIDRINRAGARDWWVALTKGKLPQKKKPAAATVCQHVRNAKVIFSHALKDDLILYNPFDRLNGNAPAPEKNWKYVTRKELHLLLLACPSTAWRMLLALCRLAGLRQGEALTLPWSGIDWEARRMRVAPQKTGIPRVTPIEPELYELLREAHSANSTPQENVIPPGSIGLTNLWRDFGVICKKAGLKRWPDWCQVLRRNCETDWAQQFPQYVVSTWIGHDIKVSSRYYLQVPEQLYDDAAAIKPRIATKIATKSASNTKQEIGFTINDSIEGV